VQDGQTDETRRNAACWNGRVKTSRLFFIDGENIQAHDLAYTRRQG